MTDSTIPFFSFQEPFAEEAHCTVSPTLKFSILLRLFRPFIADCQSASLPTIERTAGTCKVRCTVVALFLDALDMLAIRTILCRRMFLPVYAIFCDSWHIIPRASYARPTVWGMKSPAGGGRGVGCYAMTFKPGTFSSMNALMFFMASPFHAPPSASTRANFTPSLSLQRNTKELSGCSTSVKVR